MKTQQLNSPEISLRLIFFFVFIMIRGPIIGQTNPVYEKMQKILTPTGDAAALGRYGDYPIDHSTGVQNISIPIYEINVNGFKIPISLSYHAAGNRVDDVASIVGLGWSLSAGGAITRTVHGLPDEINTLPGAIEPYICRYDTRETILTLETVSRLSRLYDLSNSLDLESDFYTFSFNGYSGRFAYNSNNELILSSFDNLKISGGPRTRFAINTPDGSIYTFIEGDTMLTNFVSHKSCWYLNQIITPDLDTITFRYNKANVQGDRIPTFHCIDTDQSNYRYTEQIEGINVRHIKSISFRNGIINFTYAYDRKDRRFYRLQYITVLDKTGRTIKKVRLGQSYFESMGANPSIPSQYMYYSRLKLDSVKFLDPTNSAMVQTYTFGYNTTSLPPYFEDFGSTPNSYYGQDYWGYYNGISSNTTLIPIENICSVNHLAANRNSDELSMQAAILKKVIFPTGGRTEFEYEANTNQSSVKVGGLRVKTIKSFPDGTTTIPSMIKSYTYPTNGYQTEWLTHTNLNDLSRWFYIDLKAGGYTFNRPSVPIGSLSFTDGMVVTYDRVNEYTGPNQEMKTEYYYELGNELYYNVPSTIICALAVPLYWPSGYNGPQLEHHFYSDKYYKDRPWRRSPMTRQIDYKKVGSNYVMVRNLINTYSPFQVHDNVVVGLKLTSLAHYDGALTQGNPECIYQYFNILWETGVKKLTRSVETLYQSDGDISKTIDYEYDQIENANGHGFVTKEILTNSTQEQFWTKNRYLPEAYPSPTGVYLYMKGKNMINAPLEVIQGKTVGSNNYFLGATVYNFSTFANIPKLYQVKALQLPNPSTTYTYLTDSRLKTEGIFDSYDQHGNLVNVTPSNNISTGYQWGYNKMYPVVKTQNAKNLILYTSGIRNEEQIVQPNSFNPVTVTFYHAVSGDIVLSMYYGQNPGTNKTASFNYSLSGPFNQDGALCTSSGTGCGSIHNTIQLTSKPAGTYTLTILPIVNDDASADVHFSYSYLGQQVDPNNITEFYYQGFEEYTGATASSAAQPSHAGKYFKTGSFTVPYTIPNARSYIVEYHYWDGTKWVEMTRAFTSNMTLTDGSAFDEIRVYPKDAQMTTYTYDLLIGMTSSTDEGNVTTYYEYDNFGRLKSIKDKAGNILQTYDYHYKQ